MYIASRRQTIAQGAAICYNMGKYVGKIFCGRCNQTAGSNVYLVNTFNFLPAKGVVHLTDAQRSAYAQAVERHSDSVYRMAMVYLRNPQDARDCCQDVFVKLMERRKNFESEEHRKAWLLAVAKNTCRDQLRREARRRTDSLDAMGAREWLPATSGGGDVLAAIFTMPANDREVLYLHYYEGYSVRELCTLLRLRESAAKQRLLRARLRLRELLGEAA